MLRNDLEVARQLGTRREVPLLRALEEKREIPERIGAPDLALLPVNGLSVMGKQVVMTAQEAADFAERINAKVVVPTHYAFTGCWFTETFVLRRGSTVSMFEASMSQKPDIALRVLETGQRLTVTRP